MWTWASPIGGEMSEHIRIVEVLLEYIGEVAEAMVRVGEIVSPHPSPPPFRRGRGPEPGRGDRGRMGGGDG